ncbi:uncharacterized protein [Montipora foliosa]|uniref:uncharacterized protein n=1 Tax=Montipora foliosa TaxID=591990 RepID=UPI0035F17F26
MKLNADREKVMQEINSVRAKSVYSHSSDDCSPECKKGGCGKLWVVDGQWKLTGDDSDPSSEEILDKEVSKVEKVLSSLGNGPTSDVGNSVVEAQGYSGNAGFIEREHGALTALLQDCLEPQPTSCNKETGGKQRLQKWSRGHLFIVRGGGIIDKWSPLFKSESPSKVFIIVLSWLFTILKCINPQLG